ncbi:NADPH-dependent FMN reductase [Methanocalculus chunghsingensis]|uniref:NADPH-dependent FMN reductase n=1 Tax=Methanocalculus chunghsingensis TaxID=156457 RepID=A0A8J7W5K7_9EURY|nr:flavodoxin family protein [Methanocalculus chunghsingensis]MBR1368716.1 NADPH-dependent FMN reductase [Methanocalculus chunghsingensis]
MGIKVLAFAGSPRRHGNSETLLDWVLDAMRKEPDVEVEKYPLTEINIAPCKGCNACEKLNTCVQKDDLVWVEQKIIDADIIILSSPIFCMGIAAQPKALIDRAQVFRSRKYVLKLPIVPPERKGKRIGIFLATAGQDWEYVFDAAIPSVKCLFNVIDVKNKDIRYLMVNNVDEKGAILEHPSAGKDAAALADEVITTMREMKRE